MSAPHPTVEELADLDEGLLDTARARQVEEHLDACADCRADVASVRAVPALLAELAVAPMPPSAARDLDAALRAEAAARAEPAASTAGAVAPVRLDVRLRSQGHPRLRAAAAAAATVAVLGTGVSLVNGLSRGEDAATSSAGGAADQVEGGAGQAESGTADDSSQGEAAAEEPPAGTQADKKRTQPTRDAYRAMLASQARRLATAPGTGASGPASSAAAVQGLRAGIDGS